MAAGKQAKAQDKVYATLSLLGSIRGIALIKYLVLKLWVSLFAGGYGNYALASLDRIDFMGRWAIMANDSTIDRYQMLLPNDIKSTLMIVLRRSRLHRCKNGIGSIR